MSSFVSNPVAHTRRERQNKRIAYSAFFYMNDVKNGKWTHFYEYFSKAKKFGILNFWKFSSRKKIFFFEFHTVFVEYWTVEMLSGQLTKYAYYANTTLKWRNCLFKCLQNASYFCLKEVNHQRCIVHVTTEWWCIRANPLLIVPTVYSTFKGQSVHYSTRGVIYIFWKYLFYLNRSRVFN